MMEEAKGQQSLALDGRVLGKEGLFSIPCANSLVSHVDSEVCATAVCECESF